MAYYKVCPYCKSNLDPEEKCGCQDEKKKKMEFFRSHLKVEPGIGQIVFDFEETAYERKSYG